MRISFAKTHFYQVNEDITEMIKEAQHLNATLYGKDKR